eukprot:scaffold15379_cov133-Isochrysis_galbana.AAC.11
MRGHNKSACGTPLHAACGIITRDGCCAMCAQRAPHAACHGVPRSWRGGRCTVQRRLKEQRALAERMQHLTHRPVDSTSTVG